MSTQDPEFSTQDLLSNLFLTRLDELRFLDPYWIRVCLERVVREVLDSAGSEEFSQEYREFLVSKLEEAKGLAVADAVAEDRFEWAQGIFALTGL